MSGAVGNGVCPFKFYECSQLCFPPEHGAVAQQLSVFTALQQDTRLIPRPASGDSQLPATPALGLMGEGESNTSGFLGHLHSCAQAHIHAHN